MLPVRKAMLPVRKSSRRIGAAKSAHSDAQRKRAKAEEAAEWSEASEDTEPMMVKGTVLTLDSRTASGKGLEGSKRNLGYYQSDNERILGQLLGGARSPQLCHGEGQRRCAAQSLCVLVRPPGCVSVF